MKNKLKNVVDKAIISLKSTYVSNANDSEAFEQEFNKQLELIFSNMDDVEIKDLIDAFAIKFDSIFSQVSPKTKDIINVKAGGYERDRYYLGENICVFNIKNNTYCVPNFSNLPNYLKSKGLKESDGKYLPLENGELPAYFEDAYRFSFASAIDGKMKNRQSQNEMQ